MDGLNVAGSRCGCNFIQRCRVQGVQIVIDGAASIRRFGGDEKHRAGCVECESLEFSVFLCEVALNQDGAIFIMNRYGVPAKGAHPS